MRVGWRNPRRHGCRRGAYTDVFTAYFGSLSSLPRPGSAIADEFYQAALGVTHTPCDGDSSPTLSITCGTLTNYSKGDFGLSFPASDFVEEFAFINDYAVKLIAR